MLFLLNTLFLGGEDYDVTHEHAPVSKSKSFSHMNNQPYQYKHKVIVRNCQLTITGDDYTYVTVSLEPFHFDDYAKVVLIDFFSIKGLYSHNRKVESSVELFSDHLPVLITHKVDGSNVWCFLWNDIYKAQFDF